VIQAQQITAIRASSETDEPVKVMTSGQGRTDKVRRPQPKPSGQPVNQYPIRTRPDVHPGCAGDMSEMAAKTENQQSLKSPNLTCSDLKCRRQPANTAPGNGILGVLLASSLSSPSRRRSLTIRSATQYASPTAFSKTCDQRSRLNTGCDHSGMAHWIAKTRSRQRIEAARSQARGLLTKAGSVTKPVRRQRRQEAVPRPVRPARSRSDRGVCRYLNAAPTSSCIHHQESDR